MPTMTSSKLSDLETERESFVNHELRIIEERDEILKNLRAHLDQLDVEIVRLGGTARDGSENSGAKKKRGRPKKETVPSHILVLGKENASSNTALHENSNKKRRRSKNANSNSANASTEGGGIGEPWTCECGERMAAGRKRCGKCRRWKGGKREIRWSRKSTGSIAALPAARLSGKARAPLGEARAADQVGMKAMSAVDVYRKLPSIAADGAAKGPRSDVEGELRSIVNDMVCCVSAAGKFRPREMSSQANAEASAGGVAPIQRLVSTSDVEGDATVEESRRERSHIGNIDAAKDIQGQPIQSTTEATGQALIQLHHVTKEMPIVAVTDRHEHCILAQH